MLSFGDLALIGVTAVAAGLVNAVAGGGTLLTFPMLTAVGVPAVAANVTNTVALCFGLLGATAAQRANFVGQERRLWLTLPVGAVGGIVGGLLLLNTNEHLFRRLIPFLILAASGLLAVQEPLRAWLVRRADRRGHGHNSEVGALLPIGLAAVYGGYFGAGLGVITLAVLGLALDDTLTRLNALKSALALTINLAAAIFFLFSGEVIWPAAAVMAVGALAGGAFGGRVASRVHPATLRRVVVIVGVVIAMIYLLK